MFTLKADSTFNYLERTDAGTVTTTKKTEDGITTTTTDSYIFSDFSFGTFAIVNDTVFLKYSTPEIAGDVNEYNVRPTKLTGKESPFIIYIYKQELCFDKKNII